MLLPFGFLYQTTHQCVFLNKIFFLMMQVYISCQSKQKGIYKQKCGCSAMYILCVILHTFNDVQTFKTCFSYLTWATGVSLSVSIGGGVVSAVNFWSKQNSNQISCEYTAPRETKGYVYMNFLSLFTAVLCLRLHLRTDCRDCPSSVCARLVFIVK